ncbi:hypothetical protein LTR97_011344 [Elasticomyces elasticus]|uniref:Uncharacterized protein n=1 Tax=Elasticomyces elasticus TaxID=574655 RepID=A0AAN7W1Q8_9PEZI|nr:hypothetical protein LTR97_011344 [Elasticomyces elasticus]
MGSAAPASSALLHRTLHKEYAEAVGGDGVYVIRSDGSRVLDGCCGAAVSCLGHSDAVVIDAIVKQAQKMPFVHGSFFTNGPAEQLARLLVDSSDGAFSKAVFLSSGSEAVETALKLARQHHLCNGQPQRWKYVAREGSYHGNTIGALSASHNPQRRVPFAPLLSPAFRHVAPCFFSRDGSSGEDEKAYVERLLAEYDRIFQQEGPETIAAMIVEPVAGATLGAVPASKGYLSGLRKLCDRYGVLLIFDEVMCGLGRVGTTHAWQSLGGIKPDLQTIGKGLAAGYQPISGVLIGPSVVESMEHGEHGGPFISAHTYQAHPIACAAALATQHTIASRHLLDNVQKMGILLRQSLSRLPHVREVRGIGLFLAVEFASKTGKPIASSVAQACLERGAAVYLCASLVDAVMLAPPFIIAPEEVEKLVATLEEAVVAIATRA